MFLGEEVDFQLIKDSSNMLDVRILDWIKTRPNIKIVDIKYSSTRHGDSALIIYDKASTISRQEARCYGI